MSIVEQVRELREVAAMYQEYDGGKMISEAADTIEFLNTKLSEANEELERWHTDCINSNIKNPFAWTSTLICHNCDHKDEYIEELETVTTERQMAFHYNWWRLCSEQLPEKSKESNKPESITSDYVLFKTVDGNIYKGFYSYDSKTWIDFQHYFEFESDLIVAWKLLPQSNNTIDMEDIFEFVGDNAIIKIYRGDEFITQGNWYQDNVLEYQDEKDVDIVFFLKDNLCCVFLN